MSCASASFLVMRALPASLTRHWAGSLDALTQTWLQTVLGLPKLTLVQSAVCQLPIAYGGFALPSLQYEAPLHYISGALALHALGCNQTDEMGLWTPSLQQDIDSAEGLLDTSLSSLLKCTPDQLLTTGHKQAMK
eukprot:59822-Amphidinium_carterae.1